jgi:hypothetical protein
LILLAALATANKSYERYLYTGIVANKKLI